MRLPAFLFLFAFFSMKATASLRFEVDTKGGGQITHWSVGGKTFIDRPPSSDSSALTLQIDGKHHSFKVAEVTRDKEGQIRLDGMLGPVSARMQYNLSRDGKEVRLTLSAVPPASSVERFCWEQPLAIDPRKRVWFRGDHNLEWETRYFYQFTVGTTGNLLPEADRNEWRFFSLDALSPQAFRLWRSESETTSPLLMQHGAKAAPLLQVYDAAGGVTVEAPQLFTLAPASLFLDAVHGGAIRADLITTDHPRNRAHQTRIFSTPIELRLYADATPKALQQTRELRSAAYPSTPRPSADSVMHEPAWLRIAPAQAPLITAGYPFQKGSYLEGDTLLVASPGGKPIPFQAKPLAYWPDHSIKHALLTFPTRSLGLEAGAKPPYVSFRTGQKAPIKIAVSKKPTSPPSPEAVVGIEKKENGDVVLTNGQLKVELGNGTNWLRQITWEGTPLLATNEKSRIAYCDFLLSPTRYFPYRVKPEGGRADRGHLIVTQLEIEETGPLRALIRLEGLTTNKEPARIILRLEALAGSPELRLTHSIVFRYGDPRQTFLTGLGIELPLANPLASTPVSGDETPLPEGLREYLLYQATPTHQEVRYRTSQEEWNVTPQRTPRKWVHFPGPVPLTASIRNFSQSAPKAISATDKCLRLELWPTAAEAMDTRRYSNYPHPSQGESVSPNLDWVEKQYYPKAPFVGISRTHELLLAFGLSPAASEPAAADFQSPPLLYAGWEQYADSGVVLPAESSKKWPKAWKGWERVTNFWLWHRELYGWYGFWNFGDLRHYFRGGYGWIVPPEVLIEKRPWKPHKAPISVVEHRMRDYASSVDWAYDNGRWGWSNSEGLPGLFLQTEYLRRGNRVVYFAAEAIGRHTRDVVTRHEGPWYGLGTRHGVQHWSCGDHEERQTTVTEYRHHYYLSGDPRSRDVIEALYRDIYSKTPVSIHASHSGRLGGLLFHWELTGNQQEGEQLQRYVESFLSPKGIAVSPNVTFPGPEIRATPRHLNDPTMFFQTFGGMHALVEYHQLTQHAGLASSIVAMADAFMAMPQFQTAVASGRVSAHFYWPPVLFAARHAADPAPYHEVLGSFLRNGAWKTLHDSVATDSANWSGPTAYLRSNVAGNFFWQNWAPYLTYTAEGGEPLSDNAAQVLAEEAARRRSSLPFTTSWQAEYDGHEALQPYLGIQQPFPFHGSSSPKQGAAIHTLKHHGTSPTHH